MTENEAEEMLERLSLHYGMPVMPINRYCKELETWQGLLRDRVAREFLKLFPDLGSDDAGLRREAWNARESFSKDRKNFEKHPNLAEAVDVASAVDMAFTAIRKSSFLNRKLYKQEMLRTRMCPEHQGRWSGLQVCAQGCDSTGWLHSELQLASRPREFWDKKIASMERWIAGDSNNVRSNEKGYLEWLKAQREKHFPSAEQKA